VRVDFHLHSPAVKTFKLPSGVNLDDADDLDDLADQGCVSGGAGTTSLEPGPAHYEPLIRYPL
jgi:hypothetical protein